MVVGSYSYRAVDRLGRYMIPGLPPGEYGVWIEPLDGSPVAALQINTRIQLTINTDFPEDWYSGSTESGAEAAPDDPSSAAEMTVEGGGRLTGIDIIIEDYIPGWCMNVVTAYRGGYPLGSALVTLAVLLLPFVFLYHLRWAVTRRE